MVITPTQTFIFALLAGGAHGAYRGWSREVIATATVLSSLLFLANGGANFLAHLLAGGIGTAGGGTTMSGPLFAGGGGTAPPSSSGTSGYNTAASSGLICTTALATAISRVTFFGLTWLGYRSGLRYGPAPKMGSHHVAGVVPGVVNGAAIAYYVSNNILQGAPVVLNTPGSPDLSSYLPVVFGLGIVGLLVVLFVAGQMKKAGGGGGGGH